MWKSIILVFYRKDVGYKKRQIEMYDSLLQNDSNRKANVCVKILIDH